MTVQITENNPIVWNPSEELIESSTMMGFMKYLGIDTYDELIEKSCERPDWFWEAVLQYKDVRFYKPYDKMMDTSKGVPWTKWCSGGVMNIVHNCLDKHMGGPLEQSQAVVWESESGEIREWTYKQLNEATCQLAEGLRSLGVGRGDVVGLHMPMIPEAFAALLAVAKIGGLVLPLFSGFGASAIVSRLNDAKAVAVITADGTWRRGKKATLKNVMDEAAKDIPTLRHVIVKQNVGAEVSMQQGRDHWWHELCDQQSVSSPTEQMEADAPFMIVYTSGTTGKPKGTVHTHCGFSGRLALDMGLCHDLHEGDRILWFSDMGWLVGPLLAYGATLLGACAVIAEGAPDYPDEGRLWRLIQDNHVTILGMAPTIIRSLMSSGGGGVEKYDLSSLRVSISTGEPWTPDAWHWMFENVCHRKVPILNYSGGSEIGGGILSGTVLHPLKPCSFGAAIPGMGADIVDEKGNTVQPGEVGELVLRLPSIGLTQSLWEDHDRYFESYWARYPGMWHQGDWALIDEDGFWYLLGRSDDTLKIAGKRTGPTEIEALVMETGKVAEVAVIGVPDDIKGQAVVCVCSVMPGVTPDDSVRELLTRAVVAGLGVPYRPKEILFVSDLPKTRNMKIMRRVVRAAYLDESPGDLSSLSNPDAVKELAKVAKASRG